MLGLDDIVWRTGKLLVGAYTKEMEGQVFDLRSYAQDSMYIDDTDSTVISKLATFNIELIDEYVFPVCYNLRRLNNKINSKFVDAEVRKMIKLGVIEP